MKPIYLHLSQPVATPGPGSSRFWGDPDLPRDCEYPAYVDANGLEHPYRFICQINLAEVAPYDTENRLPHEGLLSFFAKIGLYLGDDFSEECIGGCIGDPDEVRVLHFPSCEGLQPTPRPGDESAAENPEALQIEFRSGSGIPDDEHALFAPPTHRPWETWDAPFEEWLILLQIDSCEGADFELNFMDVGLLEFLISPDDLARHRFDRIRAVVLSS